MSTLIGRVGELAKLTDALARTTNSGEPVVVTIGGPCGIGKGALLEAFLAGLDAGTGVTFIRAERLERLVPGKLAEALQSENVVLAVDDAQWCDPASLDLLDRALESAHRSWLVLLAYDDEAPALRGPAERVTLRAMNDDEIARIVRQHAPALPDAVVRTIVERANGIPYEAAMLANMAAVSGATDAGDVDASAGRAIARFIAARTPSARTVAHVSALIAAPVERRLARELWHDQRELERALDSLAPLMRGDRERIAFAHALTAAAVVETIPMKIPLHRRIISALERAGTDSLGDRILLVEQLLGSGDRALAQQTAIDLAFAAAHASAPSAQLWASTRHLELGEPPDERFIAFYTQFFNALMDARDYARAEAVASHALSEVQRRSLGGVVTLAAQLIQAQWMVDRRDAARASYERYAQAFASPAERAELRAAAPWLRAS